MELALLRRVQRFIAGEVVSFFQLFWPLVSLNFQNHVFDIFSHNKYLEFRAISSYFLQFKII